jgi:hypothetical protein
LAVTAGLRSERSVCLYLCLSVCVFVSVCVCVCMYIRVYICYMFSLTLSFSRSLSLSYTHIHRRHTLRYSFLGSVGSKKKIYLFIFHLLIYLLTQETYSPVGSFTGQEYTRARARVRAHTHTHTPSPALSRAPTHRQHTLRLGRRRQAPL